MHINFLIFFFFWLLYATFSATAQKVFSLEVPLAFSGTFIIVPAELQQSFNSKFSAGILAGAGIKYNPKKYLGLRLGLQYFNKPFRISYLGYFDAGGGIPFYVDVAEKGNIRYVGIYTHVLYDRKKIFLGGGPEVSVWNTYRGSWSVFDHANGQLMAQQKNGKQSTLNDKFIQQLDLSVMLGYKIWLKDAAVIKPYIGISSPMLPLYFSEQQNSAGQSVNLSAMSFRLGIAFELIVRGDVQLNKTKPRLSEKKPGEFKKIYELER